MSTPPLLFVSRRTEARIVLYTPEIAKYVSSCSSPVPSLALCVGSNDQCGENQCCLEFEGTLHRSFSSPNADDNLDGCEAYFKHDHHNASLVNFNNVVCDRLNAEPADNDGDRQMCITVTGFIPQGL